MLFSAEADEGVCERVIGLMGGGGVVLIEMNGGGISMEFCEFQIVKINLI